MLLLYSQFLKKSLQFANLRPSVFYLFEVQSTVLVSSVSSSQGENVLNQQLFLTREERKLCGILIKSQKLCLHKIFNIALPRKLIAMNLFFYTQFKMNITLVSLKNYSFCIFFEQIKLPVCLFLFKKKQKTKKQKNPNNNNNKKKTALKKCLCNVYVYAMALT